jgi:hypothetical protein
MQFPPAFIYQYLAVASVVLYSPDERDQLVLNNAMGISSGHDARWVFGTLGFSAGRCGFSPDLHTPSVPQINLIP